MEQYRHLLSQGKIRLEAARSAVASEKKAVAKITHELEVTQIASSTFQEIAQSIEQAVHDKVAKVVSECLSAIFDDPYEFRILFDKKRSKTEATLVFVRDGLELDSMTAAGGGVVDVAAFALRVACLVVKNDSKVLILDEPFKFLSEDLHQHLPLLLKHLSDSLGIQFVVVTHLDSLRIGRILNF